MASSNREPTIFALGSVNADFQVRTERWPEPGETLLARDFALLGGGKSANVAFFARRVGLPAALIAHLGGDFLADRALAGLAEAQVDLSRTRRIAECATGVAMISVRADGDKTILLAANANEHWAPQDAADAVEAVEQAACGSVLATNLEIPPFVVQAAAEAARARGIPVVLDPSPAERMTDALYRIADVLTPNRSEAAQLLGHAVAADRYSETAQAAEQLRSRGANAVMLKLRGDCLLAHAQGCELLRAVPAEPVDTTGAGDAFAAAVAVGLLERRPLRDCALLGMAASMLAIQSYGSQPAYPDRARLLACFERFAACNAQAQ